MTELLTAIAYRLCWSLVVCLSIGMASCGNDPDLEGQRPQWGRQASPIPIEQAQQPQQTNKIVYLKGTAGKQAPFLGSSAYELIDATGSLWVVTKARVPPEGTEVLIKGQILYQSIPLAGREAGEFYLEELERY